MITCGTHVMYRSSKEAAAPFKRLIVAFWQLHAVVDNPHYPISGREPILVGNEGGAPPQAG